MRALAISCLLTLAATQESTLPPEPARDLVIREHESLAQLTPRWADEVGIVLSMSPETERLSEQTSTSLLDDLRVPRDWANVVFGAVLAERAFVLHPITTRVGPVFGVISLDTSERLAPRRRCFVTRDELVAGRVMAALQVEVQVRFEQLDPVLVQRDLARVLPRGRGAQVLVAGRVAFISGSAVDAARLVIVLEAAERAASGATQGGAWPGADPPPVDAPACDLAWHPFDGVPGTQRKPTAFDLLQAWSRATGLAVLAEEEARRCLANVELVGERFALTGADPVVELEARLAEAEVELHALFAISDPAAPRLYALRRAGAIGRASIDDALSLAALALAPPTRAVTTAYVPLHRDAYTLVDALAEERGNDWRERVQVVPLGPRLVVFVGGARAVSERVEALRELDRERGKGDGGH